MIYSIQGLTFECDWTTCPNPDCPCRETTFQLTQVDAKRHKVSGGCTFVVDVNLDTGKASEPRPRTAVTEAVLRDFLAECRTDLLARMNAERVEMAAQQKRIQEYVISRETIERGFLVPFVNLIADPENVAGAFMFSVDHDGVTYYGRDLYCSTPEKLGSRDRYVRHSMSPSREAKECP